MIIVDTYNSIDNNPALRNGWKTIKLKRVAELLYGESLSSDQRVDEGSIDVYGSNGIVGKHSIAITKAPCIIIGRKGSYGKINYSHSPCFPIDTTYYIDRTSTSNDIRYVFYLLQSLGLDQQSRDSAVPGLNREEAYRKECSIPKSINTQKEIADYLDNKTEQINKIIQQKEQLLEKLQAKRQAIINEAVTKGLNPNVPMNPSGVEWLGNIPEHWKVKRLKYLTKITTGNKNTEDRIEDGLYPFFVRSQTVERINSYSFDGEGILTAGDGVGVAKVFHYINGKFDFHQRVYLFYDFSDDISARFLFYYLKANLEKEVLRYNAKSTVDSLRLPMFKAFPVSLPDSKREQEMIVNYIDRKCDQIDDLSKMLLLQIQKIKQYRQSLISEVVTGKIKVV